MSYIDKRKQIDLLQEQINSHGELSAEVKKKINYKFRLDWNYYSNSMEGNTLTMEETRSVMIGNLTVGGKPIKDVMEIHGHDEVISKIIQIGKGEIRLSEGRIKEIHSAIIHEDDANEKKKIGQWKTLPNHVINYKKEKFDFAEPSDVADRMHSLLNGTNASIDAIVNKKKDAPHPLDVALNFHLDYITIHPFYDGNGRTARILTNLLLISFGYPPIIIKKDEKDAYYRYLADIQAYGGNPILFFGFMADLLLRSQHLVIDAIAGKEIEEPDDLDKKIALIETEIANVDVENEVQAPFSRDDFFKIYDTWLSDLMKGLIVKVRKFDKFFVQPAHYISVMVGQHSGMGGQGFQENIKDKSEDEIVHGLKNSLVTNANIISADTTISVHAIYGTFKKGALKNPFGCNYHIDVIFDYLKYEIYIRKFILGVVHYPIITNELKDTLRNNPNIKMVYFDANGGHYFDAFEAEDGGLLARSGEGEIVDIILSYSSNDIIEGKVKDGGLVRFIEPRLLHKPLSTLEIEKLCKQFANSILEHIDYYTKVAGLR